MVFSSEIFIFGFLPLVLFGYYVVFRNKRGIQNCFLCVMSLLFYAWGEPKYVFLMLASIMINWYLGLKINEKKHNDSRKTLLVLTVVFNIGVLFIFKYLSFAIVNLNFLCGSNFTVPTIALPIGISFFTFQAMSYVVDIYRGNALAQKNPLNVALYISFFPQLIAGPIVRYETIAEQIKNRRESLEKFSEGFQRFILGFGKKIILADNLAMLADFYFNVDKISDFSIIGVWIGSIAYTLQIYYDFSGYSDMAIGLAKIFGFDFEENFMRPYRAKSITDFWRRWHISLSHWFRDYVYIPLGGNRVEKKKQYYNLFVVWLLTGIWHGANWTFVCWGLGYLILLIIEKNYNFISKIPLLSRLYTLFWVDVLWVLFRSENISFAIEYLKRMFGLCRIELYGCDILISLKNYWPWFIIAILCVFPLSDRIFFSREEDNVYVEIARCILIVTIFFLSISAMMNATFSPFIYFNF